MSTTRYELAIKLTDEERQMLTCFLVDEAKRKYWREHAPASHRVVYEWIHDVIEVALEDISTNLELGDYDVPLTPRSRSG